LKKLFRAAEAGPGGLTATRGRSDRQPLFQGSLTATRGGLTASSSNGQIFLKLYPLPLWRSDRKLYCGLTASYAKSFQLLIFGVWSINTHPSHTRWVSWPFQQHT
jgi:hypothetical protein